MIINQPSKEVFYKSLAFYLKSGNFLKFKDLIDKNLNFHLDPKLIPERFVIISDLLIDCLRNVPGDTSYLGKFIDILRNCNNLSLLEKDLTEEERNILNRVKTDKIFLANLNDLFGKLSNSFIFYIKYNVPRILYNFITRNLPQFFENTDRLAYYVKNLFLNQFTIYGLSVKYISSFKDFLDDLSKNNFSTASTDYFEFNVYYEYYTIYSNTEEKIVIVKRHLISPKSLLNLTDKILSRQNYNFYNLSMVLLGGIGPQGHGFTYSTPRGEVIEICSDIKENDAIIIKYKQFLKQQFLKRLSEQLKNFDKDLRTSILDYLDSIFHHEELIGYRKKDIILQKITNNISNFESNLGINKNEFNTLIEKISDAISIILRPISMVDQFKCRIDLINQGKLKSEDIAKLTSLEDKRDKSKSKTHYDVLRERMFFQYVNDWFYNVYIKIKKKNF